MKLIRNKLTSALGIFSGKKYVLFLSKTKSLFFQKTGCLSNGIFMM